MSFSPVSKNNFIGQTKGHANAAPDSLLRTQNGFGIGSSSRLMVASWKKNKKNPEISSPNHLAGLANDACCNNDSVCYDMPVRAAVFSFDRAIYDFCYAEGSADKPSFGCPSSTKMSRQLFSGKTGQVAARFSSKKRRGRPSQAGISGNSKNQLRLISLFEEDENLLKGSDDLKGRKIKQNKPALTSQPLSDPKDTPKINPPPACWQRPYEEDPISQYLKIEPEADGPMLGKRAPNPPGMRPQESPTKPCSDLHKQAAMKASWRPAQACRVPSGLHAEAVKHTEMQGPTDTRQSAGAALDPQRLRGQQQPNPTQNTGLVIHTNDPNDFYSDSESQQRQTYELSSVEVAEMKAASVKALSKSDSGHLCCKLEESSDSAGVFVKKQTKPGELFSRLLLPAVSSSECWTNRSLEKGGWLVATKDSEIGETLKIREDAEVFDLSRLQAYFNHHMQVTLTKKNQRAYLCKYCGIVFRSGCALGGHISKIHRGVNLDYSIKMQHRRESKVERDRSRFLKQVINNEK